VKRANAVALLVLAAYALRPATGAADLAGQRWLNLAPDAAAPDAALESIPVPDAKRLAWLAEHNADYVDLLKRTEVEFLADGNVVTRMTLVRHFLRSDAAAQASNPVYDVRTTDEDAVIVRAYTVTRDRKRTFVDPGSIQVTTATDPLIFSDSRDVTIPLPATAAGTTSILRFEVRSRASDWPLPWSSIFGTDPFGPAERIEIDASWGASIAPPHWATNDAGLRCGQDARELHCEKGRTEGIALDPDMDGYFDRAPALVLTTATSWDDLTSRIARLVDEQLAADDAVAATARDLVRGKRTDSEKVEALHRFVSDEIRYVGLEQGTRAVTPEKPAVTLERRYGDCKGKVALVVALARAAGISGHPVLATTGHYAPASLLVPATAFFDHMIACFPEVDGAEVCIDPTVPGLPAAESALPRSGGVVLDLQSGVTAPRTLALAQHAWEVDVDEVLQRDCQGGVRTAETRHTRGMAALHYRETLRPATPSDRQRILNEEVKQIARSLPTRTWSVSDLAPGRGDVTIASQREIPPPAGAASLTEISGFDFWLIAYGLGLRSVNAHHPLRLPGMRYASRVEVHLCPQDRARDFGAELDLHTAFGNLSRSFARTSDGLVISTVFDVPSGEVPVDRLSLFARFVDAAVDQAGWWIGLPGH
jgi:hypothetical protein